MIAFRNVTDGARRFSTSRSDKPQLLRPLARRIVLAAIALNIVVAALVGLFLTDYAESERKHAWTTAENLNRALDAGLEGDFAQIDLVLQTVADEYLRQRRAGGVDALAMQSMLDRQAERLRDIEGLRIADAGGQLRFASKQQITTSVSVNDRNYFRRLRDDPNAGMVISKPELGRVSGKWVALFARRLSDPDGAFAGEVHVALPTAALARSFSAVDVGAHGVVSLWNDSPLAVARFPEVPNPGGVLALAPPPSPQLARLLKSGLTSAAYRATSGTDAVSRTYYVSRMSAFPLYLIVGLADSDYAADWNAVAAQSAALYTLLLIASGLVGAMIYLRAAAQVRAGAQSRLAASVYENSSEGMTIIDAKRRIVDVNRSFTALTGFALVEVRGTAAQRLLARGRNRGQIKIALQTMRSNLQWSGELWMRRRDGEAFLARISFSTVDGQTDGASNYVAQFSDATEKKRAEETIWRHANFDLVTQLPNRRLFTEKLQAVISRSQSSPTRTVVVFVDLDRFKDVNDRFGHQVGDLLLQQAAGRIKACVRATDLVARLGGDEFTVMLADVSDLIGAERVAQEIILALARPYRLDGELVFNSASLGITVFPDDGSDVETLLRNADQAMHAAKRSGRNRLQYFAAGLRRMNTARAGLANDLHAALANDELDLHYQPIVDLATGRMFKAEALARWRHPKRGSVPPDEFIPIAEETGLIVEISDWAFRRATAQALEWRRRFDPAFQISVNVFAAQLLGLGDAAAYFGELVGGPGLDRGAVIIEITESVLLDASQAVRRLFQGYREAGIEIALDDFGTGYSSLAYLKDFEINYLKIDRAFVSNLTERSRDLAICEAVVAMAHKLGIRVVAEGVETEAQRTLLASADCDFAQGYFYARPLSATDFEATVFTTTMKAVG